MPVAVFNVQVCVYVHPATYVYLLGDCKEHTSVSFVLLWPGHVSIFPNIDILANFPGFFDDRGRRRVK